MQLEALDHVNVRTSQLEAMEAFYGAILGMHAGKRPPFSFGGRWLYVGERAAIHLVDVAKQPAATEPAIEHFAFRATGLGALLERLAAANVRHRVSVVPEYGLRQVHLYDPDGNHVEVGFPASEPIPDGYAA